MESEDKSLPHYEANRSTIFAACRRLGWPLGPRPAQQQILDRIFSNQSVLAVLPTSGGKSGLYQIPALAREGMVVVISPLIALMTDQVGRLQRYNIPSLALNSHISPMEKRKAMDRIRSGEIKVLYLSPERMSSMEPAFFGSTKIQLYAVDEAHCISEWGHDFRPAYLRLGRMLDRFPPAQRLALTATATKDVVDEVSSILKIDPTSRIVFGANRPNIAYGVAGAKSSLVLLVKKGGTPCLVYGSTRESVEEAAVELSRAGYRATHYHAGMGPEERYQVQDLFQKGGYDVVAATCAFGMGVDHPGIRSVVHLEMPSSLEAYSQETGRAGRNGDQSKAIVRATVDTLNIARSLVPLTWPSPYRVRMLWRYLDLWWDDARFTGWLGEGQIQATDTEIGNRSGMDPTEVSSCLRILHDHGHLERVPYRDRPVVISLLSGRTELKGKRQKEIISKLEEHSDEKGEIVGSVGFFIERIGLDRAYALQLNERHAIRMVWAERCQVLERKTVGPDVTLDEERMARVRERAISRIAVAEQFLYSDRCRREYLLDYFGGSSVSDLPTGAVLCCDRCITKPRSDPSSTPVVIAAVTP